MKGNSNSDDVLSESDQKFRIILEEAPIGIITCDKMGWIQSINKAALELLDSPSEKQTKKINLLEFKPLKDVGFSEDLHSCLTTGEIVLKESTYTSKWGKTGQYMYKLVPLVRNGKEIEGAICIIEDITSLRESETKVDLYRKIMEYSNDAIAILDPYGRYIEQNSTHELLLGFSDSDLEGMTPAIHLGEDVFSTVFQKLVETGHFRGDVISERKDGKIIDIDLAAFTIHGEDNNPLYYVGVKRNITPQKEAMRAVEQSEARLAEAQRIAKIGSWEWDIVQNKEIWSDEVYRIFGLNPEGFAANYEAFLEAVHPDDREIVRESVQAALYEQEPYSLDHRIIRPDGSVRFVREEGAVYFDDKKNPVRMVGTIQDITEKKLIEMDLEESEEIYRFHFENATDVILSLDSEGKILKISPSVEYHIGYKPEQLVNRSFLEIDIIAPEYIDQALKYYEDILKGDGIVRGVFEFVTKSGERIFGEINGRSLQHKGKTEAVIVIRDVTKTVRTEKLLKTARDSALLYLDLMGHDLANQLQAILSTTSLLMNNIYDLRMFMQLEQVMESVEKCANIISRIKSTEDMITAPLRPRSLVKAVKECIRDIQTRSSDINIHFSSPLKDASIFADQYLEIIIHNILENAIGHNPKDEKHVWIELVETEYYYDLSIADNGPGLSLREKQGLFDLERRFGGVGVHQTRQIVEKYGGSVKIEDRISSKQNQGLKFILRFPKKSRSSYIQGHRK